MGRWSVLLAVSVLLWATSNGTAAAQPHPRAAELLELHRTAFGHGDDAATAGDALSLNMYTRTLFPNEQVVMLLSLALDRNEEVGRLRLCLDGRLALDNIYRDGTISSWSAATGAVTVERADQSQVLAELESSFTDPMAFLAFDAEVLSYDGFVDYRVISGEQITVRLSSSGVMSIAGGIRQVGLIFAEDGRLLGQYMRTPAGPLVAVSDGSMRVETGLVLRGLSVYYLVDGEARKGAIVRFFRVRAVDRFDAGMFDLDSRTLPSPAAELAALSDRLHELSARIRRSEPGSAEFDDLVSEQVKVFREMGRRRATGSCPPPF